MAIENAKESEGIVKEGKTGVLVDFGFETGLENGGLARAG
jgi:hypothetical protein